MSRDRDLLEASPSAGWRTVYHAMGVSSGGGLADSGVCLTRLTPRGRRLPRENDGEKRRTDRVCSCLTCLTPNQDINAHKRMCAHTSAIVAPRRETGETETDSGRYTSSGHAHGVVDCHPRYETSETPPTGRRE